MFFFFKIVLAVWDSLIFHIGFLGGAEVKNLPANAEDVGDLGLIPGSGRSLGVENGNSL